MVFIYVKILVIGEEFGDCYGLGLLEFERRRFVIKFQKIN